MRCQCQRRAEYSAASAPASRTVEDLKVPAIYLDKSTAMRSPVLTELAREAQVRTGVLYSDTLDAQAPHYAQMMLANAHTIALCSGAGFWRRFFGC